MVCDVLHVNFYYNSNSHYLSLHVRVQQWFSHESHATDETLVRLLVTVNKTMSVSVVAAVECFSAYLKYFLF